MDTPTSTRPWEQLQSILESGSSEALASFLESLTPTEAALAISRLDEGLQARLLTGIVPEEAARLIKQLPDAQAADIVEQLHPARAAAIIDELPSNEQADLLTEIEDKEAAAILSAMDPADAEDARRLAEYPDDVAGGLMITEYVSYPLRATVRDVIEDLRRHAGQYADYDVQYAYIVTREGLLAGVLRLRDLLLAPEGAPVSDVMIDHPRSVNVHATLDELGDFFEEHAFFGAPVLDDDGRLAGVVRRHDVVESFGERADSDYLKSQGIVGGEELRTMPLVERSRRRLAWLSINIVLNLVAASVIAFYEETLAAVIALAMFLPIISDMSGCSGNQAVAVSMRELTLGLVRPHELLRVWLKEVTVGMINGIVLGVLIGLVAWLWRGSFYVGLVVGAALAVNTVVAVSIGGSVPLILRRLRLDPALASGPILTTVTDMCGFFFVLSLATLLLSKLT